jgi:hypothetical protein
MGGRFGKYGDVKRRQVLRQTRQAMFRLESSRLKARVRRSKGGNRLGAPNGRHDRFRGIANDPAGDKPPETG